MDNKKIELLKIEEEFDVEVQGACNSDDCMNDCVLIGAEGYCTAFWSERL